ncbi:TPA: hypothetical protein ACQJWO_005656 [Klebsiella pneumoniae]
MNSPALRETILQAQHHEQRHAALAGQLEARLDDLHPAIRLPDDDPAGALLRFVSAYVEQVPELLEAAHSVAREAGIEAQLKPLLRVAEQFFLSPPALLDGHLGLEVLLDEAYLAHRLVEEVNDCYITHLGQPLIPLDTTRANVVAHQLIGEPFANQLDQAVQHILAGLLDPQAFSRDSVLEYRQRLASPRTLAAWQHWPCLSRQLGVELGLPLG